MYRPRELLPALDDFSSRIEAAERSIRESDARVVTVSSQLKGQWKARAPGIAVAAVGIIVLRQLLRSRSTTGEERAMRSAFRALRPFVNVSSLRALAALGPLIAGIVAKKTNPPLATVERLDLPRFGGLWYEIARLPTKHEEDCARDVTAHYQVFADGVLVTNRCRRRDGSLKKAVGRGRILDAKTYAKLKVSFAPSLLDAIPGVWGDFWVLDIANDYSVAMVGTPKRDALWLLAREPDVSGAVLDAFLAKASALGFDTTRLIYTEHSASEPASTSIDASKVAAPLPEVI